MPVTEQPVSPNANVVVKEEAQGAEKSSTATDNQAGLLNAPYNDLKTDELEAVYHQRAASIRRQKELEKVMQEALVCAQENQQFYIQAQREYHEIDDKIDADNERIREISGVCDEISTKPSTAFVDALMEVVNSGQFSHGWQDLESDTSSISSHYVNPPM